jgi:hypothetical protein
MSPLARGKLSGLSNRRGREHAEHTHHASGENKKIALLIAVIRFAPRYARRWARTRQRRHPNVASVALANKNARIVWAMLSGDASYQPAMSMKAA